MKYLFLITALTLCLLTSTYAQTDTLVVTLKNKTVEKIAISQIQKMQFENVTSVDELSKTSSGLSLKGNYPNPFGEQTSIEFEIETSGSVEVIIYDNEGKQIQKLQCNNCQAGKNTLQWNCLDNNNNRVQSGMYYYEVLYGQDTQSKKMMLIK